MIGELSKQLVRALGLGPAVRKIWRWRKKILAWLSQIVFYLGFRILHARRPLTDGSLVTSWVADEILKKDQSDRISALLGERKITAIDIAAHMIDDIDFGTIRHIIGTIKAPKTLDIRGVEEAAWLSDAAPRSTIS